MGYRAFNSDVEAFNEIHELFPNLTKVKDLRVEKMEFKNLTDIVAQKDALANMTKRLKD